MSVTNLVDDPFMHEIRIFLGAGFVVKNPAGHFGEKLVTFLTVLPL